MFFILHLICVFYMFTYALSPRRSGYGRLAAIAVIIGIRVLSIGFGVRVPTVTIPEKKMGSRS